MGWVDVLFIYPLPKQMGVRMWKENFAEYVTGIAFSLQLSKRMCDTLIKISEYKEEKIKVGESIFITCPNWAHGAMVALERRGLIEHNKDRYYITEAGRLAYCLLKIAFDKTDKEARTNLVLSTDSTPNTPKGESEK